MSCSKHFDSPAVKAALAKMPPDVQKLFSRTLVNEVQDLLDDGNKTGERVSGMLYIRKRLNAASLARLRREKPEFCVIDPDNRFTLGCSGHNAEQHGEACCDVGWSVEKTLEAVGWDAPPPTVDIGSCSYPEIVKANERFQACSGGLIPPPLGYFIVMLGSTHTVVWLRQVMLQPHHVLLLLIALITILLLLLIAIAADCNYRYSSLLLMCLWSPPG